MFSPASTYLRLCAWAFALVALAFGGFAVVSGVTLGLFLAGLALGALLVPLVSAVEHPLQRQLLSAACVTDAIALIWLVVVLREWPTPGLLNWLGAYALIVAVALLQVGMLRLFWKAGRATSASLCILITLAWLTAPVWLFHHLTPGAIQLLINIHPLFAMNAAVPLSVWTEAPIAYRILNLNQDIFYAMPSSPLWCVTLHASIGAGLIWVKAQLLPRRNTD